VINTFQSSQTRTTEWTVAKSQAVELGAVVFYEVEAEVVLELPAIVFASASARAPKFPFSSVRDLGRAL
jgi:hypothetical protein